MNRRHDLDDLEVGKNLLIKFKDRKSSIFYDKRVLDEVRDNRK